MEGIKAQPYEINLLLTSFLYILSLCPFLPKVTSLILIVKKYFRCLSQTQATTGNKVDFNVTEEVGSVPTKPTTAPGSPVSIATSGKSASGTACNLILSSCEKPHTVELFLTRQYLSFQLVPPTNYHDVYRLKLKLPTPLWTEYVSKTVNIWCFVRNIFSWCFGVHKL